MTTTTTTYGASWCDGVRYNRDVHDGSVLGKATGDPLLTQMAGATR